MPVRHFQLHQAQRVLRSGLLNHRDPPVLALRGGVALSPGPARIAEHLRTQPLALHDRLRYRPGRVEHHALDHFGKLRSGGAAGFAHHGAVRLDDLVPHGQAQLVFGYVGHQIFHAQIARQPAPAVHVSPDERAPIPLLQRRGRQFRLERGIVGVDGSKIRQGTRDVSAGQRVFQHFPGRRTVGVGIHHEPLLAPLHRGAAIADVLHQPGKGFRSDGVERLAFPLLDCQPERFGFVIRRLEPVFRDGLDDVGKLPGGVERPFAFQDGFGLNDFARYHANIVEGSGNVGARLVGRPWCRH